MWTTRAEAPNAPYDVAQSHSTALRRSRQAECLWRRCSACTVTGWLARAPANDSIGQVIRDNDLVPTSDGRRAKRRSGLPHPRNDPLRSGYPSQMRILLEAYSCRVGEGSEPGQGWGWALALARHGHNVTVMTRPKNRAANEAWIANNPTPGLGFEYISSQWGGVIERRVSKQVDYMTWTRRAASRARLLHRREPFDVAHHVTFGTILLGSAIPRIGVPFVYGPLGGGQSTPTVARAWFEGSWPKERARNAVVRATPLNPLARHAVRGAVVLATNDQTAKLASQMGAREVLTMADTGIDESLIRSPRSRPCGGRLIWVGARALARG